MEKGNHASKLASQALVTDRIEVGVSKESPNVRRLIQENAQVRTQEAPQQPQSQPQSSFQPLGEIAGNAIAASALPTSDVRGSTKQNAQVKSEPVSTSKPSSSRASATATTSSAGSSPSGLPLQAAASSVAQQGQPSAPAPSLNPSSLVINMQEGRLSSGGAESIPFAPEQWQGETNQLGNVAFEQPPAEPRSANSTEPSEGRTAVKRDIDESVASDVDFVEQERQRVLQQHGRREIMREGILPKIDPPRTVSRANRTFGKIRKLFQEAVNNALKGGSYSGTRFYETIFSMPSLMPHCVSIGTENLYDSLREPNSTLLALVNMKRREADPNAEPLSLEECLVDIRLLANAINDLSIEVTLDKTPDNINHSIQVRTLRVHFGRGIGLHPTQTKAYNADYDGDPAQMNLDQTQLIRYARAMDRLVSIEGYPMIDPGFFPLEHIDDKAEALELMKKRNLSWDPSIADQMIDAYIAVCNEGDWIGFLRRIDEVADEYASFSRLPRNELSAGILKSLYDFSIDLRGLKLGDQLDAVARERDEYLDNVPEEGVDPVVWDLVRMYDEISVGRRPPSLIEFTRFFNKFYGDIRDSEGRSKNVPFRLLADFAKMINRTDLVNVGSDLFGFKIVNSKGQRTLAEDPNAQVSIHDLWQFTCVASLTKQISGRCYTGSHELFVSTQVRTMILRDCPLEEWASEEEFRGWMSRFRESYNLNMRMLSLAQTSFTGGMGIRRSESAAFDSGIGPNFEDVAEAFVEVFGQRTVGSVFGSLIRSGSSNKDNTETTIARFYADMPIDKFVANNRLVWRSEKKGAAKFSTIEDRFKKGEYTQMDLIMLIADRRTKQFGEYRDAWLKATDKQFKASFKIPKYKGEDYEEYSSKVMELISTMSPDMFLYYGMDSPTTFERSKYGKKLLETKSVEEYRSVLFSMMVEYRFGKASGLLNEMEDAKNNTMIGISQVQRIEELDAAFENELETLGSSSFAWQAIVSEQMNGSAVFKQLMQGKGHLGLMYASKFWDRPADQKEKYYSLMNFLKSSEPLDVKLAVLADVARVTSQYKNLTPAEMLGQVAHHPDRAHAGSRFDMDSGLRGEINSVKESSRLISSYMDKTPDKIRKEADRILKPLRAQGEDGETNRARFMAHLTKLASEPGYAIHVDTMLAADAVASVYDKTYSDGEKTKQQASVNGYFGCVSHQRNGGHYTHLYMADNAVVNTVGFDQLTNQDIIRVLADPSFSITIYDEFGTPATLSREKLCGGNSDADVISYLEANPRVALLCQRSVAGISDDVDGTARLNSINAGQYAWKGRDRIFAILNDRPRFLAIAALVTPGDGNVGRNMSEEISENIKKLCDLVGTAAFLNMTHEGKAEWMADKIGLDQDTIIKLRNEGRFDPTDIDDEDIESASVLYEDVVAELLDCVGVVQRNFRAKPSLDEVGHIGRIDASSMISYYDARQQISGARTNVMIGIEGGETKKNLVLKTFLKERPDKYTMSPDGTTVVLIDDENEPVADQSLVRDKSKLISSICKFLEVKRENGAETYNAKYKKYGDDGSNSMLKFIRMATRRTLSLFGKDTPSNMPGGSWATEDAASLLERVRSAGSKEAAVPILAQALIDADIRLGYIDVNKKTGQPDDEAFIPSDYWNRADLMIAENGDGTLVVRTLEQISVALRNRLSDEAVVSGNLDLVLQEMESIVSTLGTDADPMSKQNSREVIHNCVYGVRNHSKVGKKHRIDRSIRQRSSSVERNYALLASLYRHFAEQMHVEGSILPSTEWRKNRSNAKYYQHRTISTKDFEGTSVPIVDELKGLVFPQDKWLQDPETGRFEPSENPEGDRDRLYDFLGTCYDDDIRLVPGPQSLVLFNGPDNGNPRFMEMLSQCYEYGITAAFDRTALVSVPAQYSRDLLQVSPNIWILPMFDIRLNGAFSESIVAAPSEMPVNPDNLITNVEDTTGEFRSGDASYHITKELANRIKIMFRGSKPFSAEDLFPNVLRTFPRSNFELDYCTNEEIQKYVLNADFDVDNLTLRGFDEAVVDIGVPETHPSFEREKRRFAIRLQEYKEAFDAADGDSILRGDCRYDSIVGFVKITIDKQYTILAPVWPFHLEQSGKVPTTFSVDRDDDGRAMFELDHSTNTFNLSWSYTGDIAGQYIKAFEGIGASNKMIAAGEYARSRTLDNGLAIDGFYYTESVASRLFPANKRILTMITAMMITRMDAKHAYNFAMSSGAFSGNETFIRKQQDGKEVEVNIREALLAGDLGITDWQEIRKLGIQYHTDPDIDKLVHWWVDKCLDFGTVNPTTLLATKTESGMLWPKITEFEAFLDPGMNFQKAWMKFMHEMDPTLMPESIDANSSGCLFKPVGKGNPDDDYGVLQMRVPHFDADGNVYHKNESVYISLGFFGEEFSGFKKVNFNGRLRTIDSLNLANRIEGDDLVQLLTFARAGMRDVAPARHIEAVPDNAIKDKSEIEDPIVTQR